VRGHLSGVSRCQSSIVQDSAGAFPHNTLALCEQGGAVSQPLRGAGPGGRSGGPARRTGTSGRPWRPRCAPARRPPGRGRRPASRER